MSIYAAAEYNLRGSCGSGMVELRTEDCKLLPHEITVDVLLLVVTKITEGRVPAQWSREGNKPKSLTCPAMLHAPPVMQIVGRTNWPRKNSNVTVQHGPSSVHSEVTLSLDLSPQKFPEYLSAAIFFGRNNFWGMLFMHCAHGANFCMSSATTGTLVLALFHKSPCLFVRKMSLILLI